MGGGCNFANSKASEPTLPSVAKKPTLPSVSDFYGNVRNIGSYATSGFNPSRTPVRNISLFRGELPNSLARDFSPRREHRDPDQPAGNDNASVAGFRAFSPDRAAFANVANKKMDLHFEK